MKMKAAARLNAGRSDYQFIAYIRMERSGEGHRGLELIALRIEIEAARFKETDFSLKGETIPLEVIFEALTKAVPQSLADIRQVRIELADVDAKTQRATLMVKRFHVGCSDLESYEEMVRYILPAEIIAGKTMKLLSNDLRISKISRFECECAGMNKHDEYTIENHTDALKLYRAIIEEVLKMLGRPPKTPEPPEAQA